MGNPAMRVQFPDFVEFAAKYDKNGDLLLEKKEIKKFQFLLNPEMPEISGYNVHMQYVFGWWDQNNDKFIDMTS